MIIRVRKFKLPKLKLLWVSFRNAVWAVLFAGILVALLGFITRDSRRANQVHAKMKREADIRAIREWIESYHDSSDVSAKIGKRDYRYILIHDDKLPECISVLRPDTVRYDAKMKYLRLIYGGGIGGRWGLTIAPKSTQSVEYGARIKILEDGAWVWAKSR